MGWLEDVHVDSLRAHDSPQGIPALAILKWLWGRAMHALLSEEALAWELVASLIGEEDCEQVLLLNLRLLRHDQKVEPKREMILNLGRN